jgi:hypothetical protein
MGLFKKLKKAFKKITGAVKKVVKKVVKGVKKVVKKIGSSKILKALAIAGAIIVTGGAALGAFGGTGALASSKFGGWMMKVSSKALSGSVFTGTSGAAKVLSNIGNFAIKTASRPFGAVGGALGSTARVGANIVQGKSAFAAGPATAAPTPFSGAALTGQLNTDNVYYNADTNSYIDKVTGNTLTDNEVNRLPFSFTEAPNTLSAEGEVVKAADTKQGAVETFAREAARNVGMDVVRGGVAQYMQGDPDPSGTPLPGGGLERAAGFDPLRIYASENNIDASAIYNQTLYGNSDPSSVYGADLFSQDTVEVTA